MGKTTTYLCSYDFKGEKYSLDIPADTWNEAFQRLRAIGATGSVDGELMLTVKVAPDWVGRLIQWWRRDK